MFDQYRMCGVREIVRGLKFTSACLHNMKADGRFPPPAFTEPGLRGACRWYEATVDFWFTELHALLREGSLKWNDCAREATRRAIEFDREYRDRITSNRRVGSAPSRESNGEGTETAMVSA